MSEVCPLGKTLARIERGPLLPSTRRKHLETVKPALTVTTRGAPHPSAAWGLSGWSGRRTRRLVWLPQGRSVQGRVAGPDAAANGPGLVRVARDARIAKSRTPGVGMDSAAGASRADPPRTVERRESLRRIYKGRNRKSDVTTKDQPRASIGRATLQRSFTLGPTGKLIERPHGRSGGSVWFRERCAGRGQQTGLHRPAAPARAHGSRLLARHGMAPPWPAVE